MKHNRLAIVLATVIAASIVIDPDDANADFLEIWARGHGTYVTGSQDLRYFELNDVGPGYGLAVGAELLQIDIFADLNFFPGGEMFNQLGLGFDIDLLAFVDAVMLAPAVQVSYYFAPNEDSSLESNRGFMGRLGLQFEVELFPTFSLGTDAYAGGVVMLPENETGLVFQGSAYAIFRFSAF